MALRFNPFTGKLDIVRSGEVSIALDDLTDTTITSPTDAQVLTYDDTTSKWINADASTSSSSSLDDLTDTTITTPTDGEALIYNSVTGKWENETVASGGSSPITTEGDLIVGDSSGTDTRLPIGAANTFLGSNGATAIWLGNLVLQATNTGIGNLCCNSITTGLGHTFIGAESGRNQQTNVNNTGIGYRSLNSSVSSQDNVCIGAYAGQSITTGLRNTAIGMASMSSIETTSYNTAIGFESLYNCKGSYNVAIGEKAMRALTTGGYNISIGSECLMSTTTTSASTAVGFRALKNNTSGYMSAFGNSALRDNTTGASNQAFGYFCLGLNITGSYNNAFGYYALGSNDVSNYNSAFGHYALYRSTGGNNSALGGFCLNLLTTETNCSAIGYNAQITASNQVQLGNSSTTAYAYGAVQDRSDMRDKTDIEDCNLGLNFILKLRPVDFKWDMRDDYRNSMPEDLSEDKKLKWIEDNKLTNINHDGTHKRNRKHHGFIAQEVKSIIDETGTDFGGYQDHLINGGDDVKSLGYNEFIAPLVKAVQELKILIDKKDERICKLEKMLGF